LVATISKPHSIDIASYYKGVIGCRQVYSCIKSIRESVFKKLSKVWVYEVG